MRPIIRVFESMGDMPAACLLMLSFILFFGFAVFTWTSEKSEETLGKAFQELNGEF